MGLGQLTRVKAKRVMGIDASTKSLAFAIFDNGVPVRCGEVLFEGSTVDERILDAKRKVRSLVEAGILIADYIGIESAWTGANPRTGLDLAYMYGAIMSELMEINPEVHRVAPITWQTAIGNPNLKKYEKDQIQNDFPGKSKSWYSQKGREIRKGRTLAIARRYFVIHDDSDNAGDAVGIARYLTETLTTPN